jgi:Mlc titration factor MtfA (ptsG expression regulator)
MFFSWLQQRRRRKILAGSFPSEWRDYLHHNVAHYRFLSSREQAKLRDDMRIFLAEKHWEGCAGLVLTDEIKVTISAQACLLVLGMEHNYFDRVRTILVYPHSYATRREELGADGQVHAGTQARLGEAWYRGPVILSWSDVREDGREPGAGHNLVFHEFAHQLDMLDGVINGTPRLGSEEEAERWKEVMTAEYQRLIDESELGRATLLDQYGTTNEAEFFAVATECFFDRPAEMQQRHPRLYELLRDYFNQDPAERFLHKQKLLAHADRELGGSTVL